MAVNKARGRSPQRTDRVLSLVQSPAYDSVVRRLPSAAPTTTDPDAPDQNASIGYAIELPDRTEDCSALRWDVVRRHHLVTGDVSPAAAMPATTASSTAPSALRVTAGFIYRCGAPIVSSREVGGFSGLCDAVRVACAGWSVGLLVLDEQPGGPDASSSVHALRRSGFVDAKSTPPHLFELTFSYVGADDEVRSQSAYGSDALTSPVAAVSWLVEELHQQGLGLEPGDTVFSGGVTAPVPVCVGGTYRVVSSSLGIATDFGVGL